MKGLLSASLIAMFLAMPSAWAQGKCLPHDQAATNLKRHYGEEAVGVGLGTEGQTIFELFVANSTGTWTILVTRTNGLSCVAASGNDWSKLAPVDVAEEGT